MKKLLLAAAGFLFGIVGHVQAAVVTFDTPDANAILFNIYTAGQSFDVGGLNFANDTGSYLLVWDGNSPNSNGTNNLIFAGFGSSDQMIISKAGGGSFMLKSLDLAISWYDANATETILINGNPLTITQTLTTYTLNLTGPVTISGVPSNTGYWLADNIVYGTPEPESLLLFCAGLAALGFAGRRAKR